MKWETVTDIPCNISQCPGIVRWDEAGRVPGSRTCDCCGSQYELRDSKLRVTRRLKPSAAKVARMRHARAIAAQEMRKIDDKLALASATFDLRGSYHGEQWHAYGGLPEYRDQYDAAWFAGATDAAREALAAARSLLPAAVRIVAVKRDGQQVRLYPAAYGGGTRLATIVAIESARDAVRSWALYRPDAIHFAVQQIPEGQP